MGTLRDKAAIATASAAGVFMAAQYFLGAPAAQSVYRVLLGWMQVVFACALVAGILAVMRSHIITMSRRPRERFYSLTLLGAIVLTAVAGFSGGIDRGSLFLWLFDHAQAPMQATVFSLLAFYITSAAYRGFRARTGESTLLILAALIVTLGRVPLGEYISPHLPTAAQWLVDVPGLAAKRGILIGIGLGMATTALKVIAGVERTYLGGR
ncbi:MAG: hypothetical protein AB1792_04280 [Candidatus Zixiibacteriota bacterium]